MNRKKRGGVVAKMASLLSMENATGSAVPAAHLSPQEVMVVAPESPPNSEDQDGSSTPGPDVVVSDNNSPPQQLASAAMESMSKESAKHLMKSLYDPWVNQTYGDSTKTKTVTTKKYQNIVKYLNNQLHNNSENSQSDDTKLKQWIRNRQFSLGPPPEHPDFNHPDKIWDDKLYLHCPPGKVSCRIVEFQSPECT